MILQWNWLAMKGVDVTDEFIAIYSEELPWSDAKGLVELPQGPEMKLLRHDPADDDAREILVRFPVGYVEPEHTHAGEHMNVILEGTMVVAGKRLGPGDYIYGPRNVAHGPFEYPDGCVLFAAHRGDTIHVYEGKDATE
jgi:anti-sigma factor ChrR (cupin superfamily)